MKGLAFILCTAILICMSGNMIKAQTGIITTIAGNGTGGFGPDGVAATATKLSSPYGVGIDSSGYLYIGDAGNNRVRKVSPTGVISTVAGTGTAGFSGDFGPATNAELNFPYGMAVNQEGIIVIADMNNNRVRSIKSAEMGGVIVTIAGTGTAGFGGDGGPATNALLNSPQGIFWDIAGNVYFGDHFNNRIRKIDNSGIITTVAGNGTPGFGGDGGPATAALLYYPSGVTKDAAGNIYIADFYNNRIRKINTAGTISTIAGTGTPGFSGDGGPATAAELKYPKDVFVDNLGNIIVSDPDNQRIRQISPSGIITTIAGTGVQAYSGDGGQATLAELNEPQGVFVDPSDNIYIGDCLNNRIRKISCVSPTVASITGPLADTICIDSSFVFTDSTTTGIWSSANLTATITGGGHLTGISQGMDTVLYTVSNTCNAVSAEYPVYINSCIPTSVQFSVENKQGVPVVFPNPATTELTVSCDPEHYTSLVITDVFGRKKLEYTIKSYEEIVNISGMEEGVYFITFTGATEKWSGRLAKY